MLRHSNSSQIYQLPRTILGQGMRGACFSNYSACMLIMSAYFSAFQWCSTESKRGKWRRLEPETQRQHVYRSALVSIPGPSTVCFIWQEALHDRHSCSEPHGHSRKHTFKANNQVSRSELIWLFLANKLSKHEPDLNVPFLIHVGYKCKHFGTLERLEKD